MNIGEHTVVLGGGIGGLTAAIALSPLFDEVTILERGEYPTEPAPRKHAPQGAHAHALLARGLQVMSRLVPELTSWLDEAGLGEGDLTYHVLFCFGGRWLPRVRSGIPIRPCTRPVVESLLLRAASRLPNIAIRLGCKAVGLRGAKRVTGVEITNERGEQEVVASDWTVDASGRRSQAMKWLAQSYGCTVEEDVVDPGVTYSSCIFDPQTREHDWVLMADVSKFPDQPGMSILEIVDDQRWMASLVGYGRAPTPKSPEDLIARVGGLSSPRIGELLRESEPLGDVAHFGNTANRRKKLGKVKGWPDGFVVLGDAACSLNPRYGQGMTTAAIGVETLQQTLQDRWRRGRGLDGVASHFQRSLDRALALPWQLALMEDRLWVRKFQGSKLDWSERALADVTQRLLDTAFTDIDTYIRFMSVAHMIRSPLALASPSVMAKTLIPALRRTG